MATEGVVGSSLIVENSRKKAIIEKIEKRLIRIFWHKDFDDSSCAKLILGPMPGLELYLEQSRKVKAKYSASQAIGHIRACYEEALLSREQEFHLFRKYNFYKYRAKNKLKNGKISEALKELKASDVVRRSIASANVRLAIPIVKKYIYNRHYEDLIGESYYLILRSVDYFDFTRGIKFSTYGTWAIIRTMQRTAMQWHDYDNKQQTGFESRDFNRQSGTSEFEDKFLQIQNKELIDTLLSYCTARERGVLKKRFFQEKTLKEIAVEMGLSRERVRQIESAALEKISSKARQLGLTM